MKHAALNKKPTNDFTEKKLAIKALLHVFYKAISCKMKGDR